MKKLNPSFQSGKRAFAGRGDLLRFLQREGEEGLSRMAEFAGYERKEIMKTEVVAKSFVSSPKLDVTVPVEHRFSEPSSDMPFWYVSDRRERKHEERSSEMPDWAREEKGCFSDGEVRTDYDAMQPPHISVVAWSRIWPLLRNALGDVRPGRQLDTGRIVEQVSRLEPLRELPFRSRFEWDSSGCLILDMHDRLLPLWNDMNLVHRGIVQLRGRSGLEVYLLENGPDGSFRKRDGRFDPVVDFRIPEPLTPVVILSDLGSLESSGEVYKQWRRFGKRLNRSGIRAVVLTPCPSAYWDDSMMRYFTPVRWDRGNRSFRFAKSRIFGGKKTDATLAEAESAALRLLPLLSPAIRVEPELLRAVRMLLPGSKADAAAEIRAWNHPEMERSYLALSFPRELAEAFRKGFGSEPEHLRKQAVATMEKYHSHLSDAVLNIGPSGDSGITATGISLSPGKKSVIPVLERGPLVLSTEMDEAILNTLAKPEWAEVLGRDGKGLFVMLDDGFRVDWPEWSDHVGHDRYGLFAEFSIFGITQRMRWIRPGSFMMGSPESEQERLGNERQHVVTLTSGVWLWDTACTQELWQAVTGENPSEFKGPGRPVESVSWNDCMGFIEKLNAMKPGLNLRLLTEAEWEYACRAGTDTPFSFGENINTDQVNYDGDSPYADGEKGQVRGETVEVKSLPENPWGLYEMHGNVWEWCSDWFGEYSEDAVDDPVGPETGEGRVLRGGSWFNHGGYVRSAFRFRYEPGFADVDFGFRLARGQEPGGAG